MRIDMSRLMRYAQEGKDGYPTQFTERQLDNAVRTIGARCRHETKKALRRSMARPFAEWPGFERVGRIELDTETDHVGYTAGQDYTAELPILRELLLNN